jgi:hypothetical protein
MDSSGFKPYLIKGGRSQNAIDRCVNYITDFEQHLINNRHGKSLVDSDDEDLMHFVIFLEQDQKMSAKGHLWALIYYYDYVSNYELRDFAKRLRSERIVRKPFTLKEFRDVNQDNVEKFKEVGIINVNQMLEAGKTPQDRKKLSEKTGVPESEILEFVKLSDLARIPGIKGVRARLYYDVGIDTVDQLGTWDPEELRKKVVEYVEESGFDGIPTLPAEARSAVEKARKLPSIVEYE